MLEAIKTLDRTWLLAINHAHAPWLDRVMVLASDRTVWFPVYAVLIGWLIYHFRWRAAVLLPLVVAAVALADSITSRLFKPYFGRPRPCHDAAIFLQLHLPDGCGGQFGFLSSHAANSTALAVFIAVSLPNGRFRSLKIAIFLWAILLSYSRMYLGAHYPTDVLGGAIIGGLLGWAAALGFQHWQFKRWPEKA
ncbi:phosphatase PAP2 family protein [Hymenobacter sp. 5317J-9]|uniref:phosphatase PAP2 family protein n=1 Tax=Hymenobacter sp. 5317J-9 TaxID=2932250 RepID=UPI001FD6C778|nr:phosphatase PAP2 family protein [Hymenobacter sp. 5317J-9]UOQ95991.1 phosphatase PAP2 family protein [Hymenobacter sp. 5317J-9]